MIEKKRIPGLDFIRFLAILFVVGSHFFQHIEFRYSIFEGTNMFIQRTFLSLLSVGVPLFLLLTGYLNSTKDLSVRYYKGIVRVLEAYLVYSLLTIAYRYFVNGEHLSIFL